MTFSASDWSLLGLPETLAIDSPTWERPARVGLDGDALVWFGHGVFVANPRFAPPVPATASPDLLREFVGLADCSQEDVRAFAAKWGVLRLCRHGLPRSHPPMPATPRGTLFCEDIEGDDTHGREPVAQWRAWATLFRLVVTLVAAVRNNEIGRPDYWRLLLNRDNAPPASLDEASRLLSDQVQKLLYVGLVLPKVDLARPQITFQGPGLFGALAAQLLLVAAGTRALVWCTECRLPYVPDRRPTPGRRTYCHDCRNRGFPERDASATYRRKHPKT